MMPRARFLRHDQLSLRSKLKSLRQSPQSCAETRGVVRLRTRLMLIQFHRPPLLRRLRQLHNPGCRRPEVPGCHQLLRSLSRPQVAISTDRFAPVRRVVAPSAPHCRRPCCRSSFERFEERRTAESGDMATPATSPRVMRNAAKHVQWSALLAAVDAGSASGAANRHCESKQLSRAAKADG